MTVGPTGPVLTVVRVLVVEGVATPLVQGVPPGQDDGGGSQNPRVSKEGTKLGAERSRRFILITMGGEFNRVPG